MPAIGYNHVVLLGSVSGGPWHNAAVEGKGESCAFSLAIPETTRDGRTFNTYVRCEAFGKVVQGVLGLHTGDTILVEGKLSWQRSDTQGEGRMIIAAWRTVRIASDTPVTGEL